MEEGGDRGEDASTANWSQPVSPVAERGLDPRTSKMSRSQSVSAAGGWFTGGGHSILATNYGLGALKSPIQIKSYPLTVLQAWTTYWR